MNRPAAVAARATLVGWLFVVLALVAGCATLGDVGKPLVPTRFRTQTGPYTIYTSGPIEAAAPELRQLQSLERQVEEKLGLRIDPALTPIEIYILDDRGYFEHFLRFYYPELPSRRAFFLAQGSRRVVYAYRGDRLTEDLRHEATHALLHAAVANLPLWMDEGLAEYFEVPASLAGRNNEHLARLPKDIATGWTPDMGHLEALTDVREMTPRDYRESWAWIHYLLDGPKGGRALLYGYLADLRTRPESARPLSDRLQPARKGEEGARLVAHIEAVRATPLAVVDPAVARATTTRFQDSGSETETVAVRSEDSRRPGLFGRLRRLFGLDR